MVAPERLLTAPLTLDQDQWVQVQLVPVSQDQHVRFKLDESCPVVSGTVCSGPVNQDC